MGWTVAYNFNLDTDVSILEAMELRRIHGRGDPRAGHLHCHKNCYQLKEGSQLLTRKASIDARTGDIKKKAHFAKWPESYTKKHLFCGLESLAKSKRESMDYANYYKNMEEYLLGLEKDTEPFFIDSVTCLTDESLHDFEISHSKKIDDGIIKSKIFIIDENKRKAKLGLQTKVYKNEFIIVMKISEYTPEQLANFKRGGIDNLKTEWDFLIQSNKRKVVNKYESPYIEQKQKKQIQNQGIAYARRLAGVWRASGFESYYRGGSSRYHGREIQTYLNKYFPEKKLSDGEIKGLIGHLKEFRICTSQRCTPTERCSKCLNLISGTLGSFTWHYDSKMKCIDTSPKIEDRTPLVIYYQDQHDSSIVFMECSVCSVRLDSFNLNYPEIHPADLKNIPKTYVKPQKWNSDVFTPIERALLQSIGEPEPISGRNSGKEYVNSFGDTEVAKNWRFRRCIKCNMLLPKGKSHDCP